MKRLQLRNMQLLFGFLAFQAYSLLLHVTQQQRAKFKTKKVLIICEDLFKMKSPWSY